MDDFIRTIPLPSNEALAAGSDADSGDDEDKLEFGFKWDGSDADASDSSADIGDDGESSGDDASDSDSEAQQADSAANNTDSDENNDEEDAEDAVDGDARGDGDDSDDDLELDDAGAAAAASSGDDEVEPSKIPRYKPGTREKVPEFSELHLSRPLLRAVKDMSYEVPTTIQVCTV